MAEQLLRDVESVYIAGPYSADPDRCTDNAIDVGNEVRNLGFTPFVPHLFHFWHQRHERHYNDWMDMDVYWLDRCDALLSLRGESPGSDEEWERAGLHGKMRFLGLSAFKARLIEEGLVICLVGPSGVGKTTLARMMDRLTNGNISEAISYTSRTPREGEEDGRDYHFVSLRHMEHMRNNGQFLEYTEYSGNGYGFAQHTLDDIFLQRNDAVAVVDKNGLEQIRAAYKGQVVGIHVVPPNLSELESRMEADGRTELEIKQRLTKAASEMNDLTGWDYTVVNNDLGNTFQNVMAIYERERSRADDILRQTYLSPERRTA